MAFLFNAFALISQAAIASTSLVATIGVAQVAQDANAFHLGAQLPLPPNWSWFRSEKVSAVLELSLGQWRGDSPNLENNRLADVAALPAIRYHPGGNQQNGFLSKAALEPTCCREPAFMQAADSVPLFSSAIWSAWVGVSAKVAAMKQSCAFSMSPTATSSSPTKASIFSSSASLPGSSGAGPRP